MRLMAVIPAVPSIHQSGHPHGAVIVTYAGLQLLRLPVTIEPANAGGTDGELLR